MRGRRRAGGAVEEADEPGVLDRLGELRQVAVVTDELPQGFERDRCRRGGGGRGRGRRRRRQRRRRRSAWSSSAATWSSSSSWSWRRRRRAWSSSAAAWSSSSSCCRRRRQRGRRCRCGARGRRWAWWSSLSMWCSSSVAPSSWSSSTSRSWWTSTSLSRARSSSARWSRVVVVASVVGFVVVASVVSVRRVGSVVDWSRSSRSSRSSTSSRSRSSRSSTSSMWWSCRRRETLDERLQDAGDNLGHDLSGTSRDEALGAGRHWHLETDHQPVAVPEEDARLARQIGGEADAGKVSPDAGRLHPGGPADPEAPGHAVEIQPDVIDVRRCRGRTTQPRAAHPSTVRQRSARPQRGRRHRTGVANRWR